MLWGILLVFTDNCSFHRSNIQYLFENLYLNHIKKIHGQIKTLKQGLLQTWVKNSLTILGIIVNNCYCSLFQTPLDGKHKVRVAVGNGLRSDIWDKFKTRYNIPNICEFFGATEGTVAFMNLSNRTGACGRYSPFIVC